MTTQQGQDWRSFGAPARVDITPYAAQPVAARPRLRAPLLAAATALIACVALLRLLGVTPTSAAQALRTPDQSLSTGIAATPPIHHVATAVRLAPADPAPVGTGGWVPLSGSTADPVRWDPCRPIRYVIAGEPLFAGGNQMLRNAIATVSRATGLRFTYVGRSDEAPSLDRPSYQPARYPGQWAPVLIDWTDATHLAQLGGDVIGRAGPQAAVIDGQERFVTGAVYLDSTDLARLMAAPFGPSQVHGAMLHELGHLVGLGHSSDPNAVMFPTDHPNAGFDASDLRGLATMGAGPCFSTF